MNNQSRIDVLHARYEKREEKYIQAFGRQEQILKLIGTTKEHIKKTELMLDQLSKVDALFKTTSDYARQQSKEQIEAIVSNCLSLIFEKPLQFIIELKEMRNKSSAEFYIIEEGMKEPYGILDSRGGGIVDIVSLSLRIAFLLKYRPKIEGPLILDEPAKHVSMDFIYNVADFLKKISIEFDRQIILISHDEHLASMADQSYKVVKKEDYSNVENNHFDTSSEKDVNPHSLDISSKSL